MKAQFSLLSATFLLLCMAVANAQTKETSTTSSKIILTEEKVKDLILTQGLEKKKSKLNTVNTLWHPL